MDMEFHTAVGDVKEWVIDHVKQKLIELHHREKEISRAQVYFREESGEKTGNKICEIDLTIFGSSLFVHRKANSYEQAMHEVLTELTERVEEQVRRQNEPPDEITSSVEVK